MDYPDYLRIRERSPRLGRLWMIGDCGYYLGILLAVLGFSGAVSIPLVGWLAHLTGGDEQFEPYWRMLPIFLVALPVGILLNLVSAYLKAIAHRRSGIHDDPPKEPGNPEA